MAKFRPEQLEVTTGATDNDTVTTKGYVDEKEGGLVQDNIIYVGKAGSDTNPGRRIGQPVLTINEAIAKVLALLPTSSNPFKIQLIDGGIYTENIIIPQYTTVEGKSATIVGQITFSEHSAVYIKRYEIPASSSGLTITTAVTGFAEIAESIGGNNSLAIDLSSSGILYAKYGIFDQSSTGSKGYNLVSGTLYIEADYFRETVLSTLDASSKVYKNYKLDDAANEVIIAAENAGKIILDSDEGMTSLYQGTPILSTDGGYVSLLTHPMFSAYKSSPTPSLTGDDTPVVIIFNAEIFDNGDHYNFLTGEFVAPVQGRYFFTATVEIYNLNDHHHDAQLYFFSTNRTYRVSRFDAWAFSTSANLLGTSGSCFADMNATDTIKVVVQVGNDTKTAGIGGGAADASTTRFMGYLVST